MVAKVEELAIDPFSKMSFDSFQVEERAVADENCLRFLGDGLFYLYMHPKHSLRDVIAPNYFTKIFKANRQAYLGAIILVTITDGKRSPEDWTTMLCRVVKISSSFHPDGDDPTLIGIITRYGKCTVATHANEDLEV